MDINKAFEEFIEKEWHDGHEPQGIDDQYVEEMEDEEEVDEKLVPKIKFKHKSQYLKPKKKDKKSTSKTADQPFAFGISRKGGFGAGGGYGKRGGAPIMMGDETEIDEKFAGWIAFYNKEKLEIKPKKGVIDSLYDAKQVAIKHFKVPKSKQGLLAIEPAHEEVEIDELVAPGKKSATGYILYHKDFSSAMQHAYDHAKKKGHVVDPKEIDDKVATGPKKPSKGKVNRYALKAGRKTVQIQVTNLDNKAYELNMYIEGLELIPEGFKDLPPHLQKSLKDFEKKQKKLKSQFPDLKTKTFVYNPETGKPDIEIKENTMNLKDTIKQVVTGKTDVEEHCGVCDEQGVKEDSDKDEPGTQGDMAAYQKKRKAVAKKFGVKSCSELEGAEKKACFSALDKAHVADHEEQVELEKMRKEEKKEQKSFSKMFSHVKSLMQGKQYENF